MLLSGTITLRKLFTDCQSMTMQLSIWHFHMMINCLFHAEVNLMEKCSFGTLLTDILYLLCKLRLLFLLMEFLQFNGVDL